jgi:hypothetical protein
MTPDQTQRVAVPRLPYLSQPVPLGSYPTELGPG